LVLLYEAREVLMCLTVYCFTDLCMAGCVDKLFDCRRLSVQTI